MICHTQFWIGQPSLTRSLLITNMRLCELSTGLRFAGAGGRATGRVVDGRGPEDTIKREKISTTCLVLCCSLHRHLQHHNTKRLPKA